MKSLLFLGAICVLLAVFMSGCTQPPVQSPPTTAVTIPPTTFSPVTAPPSPPPSTNAKALLTSSTWALSSIVKNATAVNLVPGTAITAKFSPSGTVNGSAGCNGYFASYNVTGDSITISPAGSTQMYCGDPAGTMVQESLYLSTLSNASTFSVTATDLKISSTGGKDQLIYVKYHPPSLTGSWRVDSMGEGGNISRLVSGSNITAVFAPDGNLTGSAGCNNYFGGFKVDGESLTLSPIGSTRMFCADPPGVMDQESKYLRILQNAKKYTITKDQLTLLDGNGRAVLFYVPM